MAFERFVDEKNATTEKVSRPGTKPLNEDETGKGAWADIQPNGKDNYFMSFNRNAVELFGLSPDDMVQLAFDPETNRVAFRKRPNGNFKLGMHGGISERLKVSVTKFFRKYLAPLGVTVPIKAYLTKSEQGWISFPVLATPEKPEKRRPGRPRKVVEEVVAVTEKRRPGRPRKVVEV